MHKLFLCLRYLRKRRIAFFGMVAVALCVALLIVITSLFDGFLRSLHGYWRQNWGQVLLFPNRPLHPWESLVEHLENVEGVSTVKAVTNTGALLYLGRDDVRGVELQGIDLSKKLLEPNFRDGLLYDYPDDTPPQFSLTPEIESRYETWYRNKFRRDPRPGDRPVPVILSLGILGRPDDLTDEYDLTALRSSLENLESPCFITTGRVADRSESESVSVDRIRKTCWPIDAVQTGIHFADTRNVYVPFDFIRELIGVDGPDGKKQCLAKIQIELLDGCEIGPAMKNIHNAWTAFARDELNWSAERIAQARIFESMEMDRLKVFTREIRKQLAIMQMIMGFICLVTALLIFVILFMIVMQKKKDIGIIRSIGASRLSVAGLFVIYGGGIGLFGSLLGLALGSWATHNINLLENVLTKLLGFKIWKSGVYLFSDIPNEVAWSSVQWILLAGITTATLGALWPAWRAARLQPIEALRYE